MFFFCLKENIVVLNFNEPKIELKPAICKENIAKSTPIPSWAIFLLKGGYKVHPVPTPVDKINLNFIKIIEEGNNQKLKFFSRGKAISGTPKCKGINQFPKPPIKTGITKKKIITNP